LFTTFQRNKIYIIQSACFSLSCLSISMSFHAYNMCFFVACQSANIRRRWCSRDGVPSRA
jgi:hypothetical protein